jgi:hypothetical protein
VQQQHHCSVWSAPLPIAEGRPPVQTYSRHARRLSVSRAAVPRRNEGHAFSSPSDDEVGGNNARYRAERASASGAIKRVLGVLGVEMD